MASFEQLVASRKNWITEVLKPWCQNAPRSELLKAEPEWLDIAGKVSAEKTLWLWAWSRFPEMVHESLGIEETSEVQVTLQDGNVVEGFPDSRKSQQGKLILCGREPDSLASKEFGPYSIDEIVSVRRL